VPTIKPRTHCFIGALCLPGHPEEPRYVFVSKHRSHAKQLQVIRCNASSNSPVQQWIKRLNALHLAPAVTTLARVPVAEAQARKAQWIKLLLDDGRCLYNAQRSNRKKPTLYVQALRHRIITERRPVKRWQRSMVTLRRRTF
jgi:hypothetical protein